MFSLCCGVCNCVECTCCWVVDVECYGDMVILGVYVHILFCWWLSCGSFFKLHWNIAVEYQCGVNTSQ